MDDAISVFLHRHIRVKDDAKVTNNIEWEYVDYTDTHWRVMVPYAFSPTSIVSEAIAKKTNSTENCSDTWALTKIDQFLKLLNNFACQLQKVLDIH